MKNIFYKLGGTLTLCAPLVAAIACGNSDTSANNNLSVAKDVKGNNIIGIERHGTDKPHLQLTIEKKQGDVAISLTREEAEQIATIIFDYIATQPQNTFNTIDDMAITIESMEHLENQVVYTIPIDEQQTVLEQQSELITALLKAVGTKQVANHDDHDH